MLASEVEVGDWFKEFHMEEPLWYVEDVEQHGDNIHIFYSKGPDDFSYRETGDGEMSEAIYDGSAILFVERGLEID